MENEELNVEESDALILQELGIAEDNSTTNVEEEVEEEQEETEDDFEEEKSEEESEEELEQEKPKKWIAKVLHQRNEARKEADEARKLAQELQDKLTRMSEEWNYGNEEYIQTLVAKQLAEARENEKLFNDADIKPFKEEILEYAKENNINVSMATKLYLADNAPELLLPEQDRNKKTADMYKVSWITPKKVTNPTFNYSDEEFEKLAKKGVIKF